MNEGEKRDLIEGYLGRMSRALEGVPAPTRRELVEDVRSHIEEAWASSPDHSRAALLNILERLGEPESLAMEQRERLGLAAPPPTRGPGLLDVVAIVLTAILWPVGVLLAWVSSRWSPGDKVVAMALPIIGLALFMATSFSVTSSAVSAEAAQVRARLAESGGGQMSEARLARAEGRAGAALGSLIARALTLYGWLGAPFTAAIYLALRMRPRPHQGAVLVPILAVAMILCSLVVLFLMPAVA